MLAFIILYVSTILVSAATTVTYKTQRLADVGKSGYKFDMDRLVEYFEELFIPGYNLYKSKHIFDEYNVNKDYYMTLLDGKKIIKRMDDTEYTEFRNDNSLARLLDISDRDDKDRELLDNIENFLFDIASYNNKYEDKKVLSFGVNEDSHFDLYYDSEEDDFITLEQTGMFEDLDEDVKMNFVFHVINFFGTIYGNYGSYKDKINNQDGVLKMNADGYDFSIKFRNLYEYVPDDIFEKKEESLHSKLLKK